MLCKLPLEDSSLILEQQQKKHRTGQQAEYAMLGKSTEKINYCYWHMGS